MPKLLLKIFLGLAAILLLLTLMRWFSAIEGVTTLQIANREIPLRTNVFLALLMTLFATLWIVIYLLRRGVGGIVGVFDFFSRRRHQRGLDALAANLIALAEGDGARALRHARKAERLLDNPDLTRLAMAKAATQAGEQKTAERYFEEMAEDPKTSFLGVQGLLAQALREDKPERALRLAERAHALRPKQPEVLDILFDLQRRKSDWESARRTIQSSVKAKRITRDVADRRLAVAHLSGALDQEADGDFAGALKDAMAAVKLAPGFTPAATLAARLLNKEGEPRTAARILAAAWKQSPHPDVAAAFASLAPEETPAERLQRFEKLFKENPSHEESQLLKAELAIASDAAEEARDALGRLPETQPSARAYALMAAIEQSQGAGETVVRGWLSKAAAAPRGPQWSCENCGATATAWRHSCAACGAFDTLTWKRSLSGEGADDATLFPLLAGPSPSAPRRPNGAAHPPQPPALAPPAASITPRSA